MQQQSKAAPISIPKAKNPATMRLHRDFVRKLSWVEAMLHPGLSESPTKDALDVKIAVPDETVALKTTPQPKRNKYALKNDNYDEFKTDQEFFQKKFFTAQNSNTANNTNKPTSSAHPTPTTTTSSKTTSSDTSSATNAVTNASSTTTSATSQKEYLQEIRSMENLAREQSDVLVAFITEVIYYLITDGSKSPYKRKKAASSDTVSATTDDRSSQNGPLSPLSPFGATTNQHHSVDDNQAVTKITQEHANGISTTITTTIHPVQEKKSFFSLSNLKSFIKNALARNTKSKSNNSSFDLQAQAFQQQLQQAQQPQSFLGAPLDNQHMRAVSLSLSDEEDTQETMQQQKNEIKTFLKKVISKVPVDPRLHVVGLMYFDRFVNALASSSLSTTSSSASTTFMALVSPRQSMASAHAISSSSKKTSASTTLNGDKKSADDNDQAQETYPEKLNWATQQIMSSPIKAAAASRSSTSNSSSTGTGMKKSVSASSLNSMNTTDKLITKDNYQKYFAMCIVLASKMWEDRFYSNLSYFELFNLPSLVTFSKFNQCEGIILAALNFKLHVSYDAFRNFIETYAKILAKPIRSSEK